MQKALREHILLSHVLMHPGSNIMSRRAPEDNKCKFASSQTHMQGSLGETKVQQRLH